MLLSIYPGTQSVNFFDLFGELIVGSAGEEHGDKRFFLSVERVEEIGTIGTIRFNMVPIGFDLLNIHINTYLTKRLKGLNSSSN